MKPMCIALRAVQRVYSRCFWHPPTFWGQSQACVSSL
jgi:hypothetical protein